MKIRFVVLKYNIGYFLPTGEQIERPQPGDVFYGACRVGADDRCHFWDNCPGQHLYCVLPNEHWWDIDGRASNCTLKDDRVHRCWVRRGNPEDGTLHVDKAGVTCSAGAGSIFSGNFHGFLHNGELK